MLVCRRWDRKKMMASTVCGGGRFLCTGPYREKMPLRRRTGRKSDGQDSDHICADRQVKGKMDARWSGREEAGE